MISKILSLIWKIAFVLLIIVFVASHLSESVSELAREYISEPVRIFLAAVTGGTRYSVFEIAAVFLVLSIPFLVWRFIKGRGGLFPLLLVLQIFFAGYIVAQGIELSAPLREYETNPTEGEYFEALGLCAARLDELCDEITTEPELDYSRVASAVRLFAKEKLGKSCRYIPVAKESILSPFLTRIGTLAYYPPPTAEAVINRDQPTFMRQSSYAHELMHFFGIMRENEATLLSFAALSGSSDAYLGYVAYLTAYINIGSRVYELCPDEYRKIEAELPTRVKKDLRERTDFLNRTAGGDPALSQGVVCLEELRGSSSYDDAARLITAYLLGQAL